MYRLSILNTESEDEQLSGTIPKLEEDVPVNAEYKLKEVEDKYLRLMAEFDNYKKRTLREYD